MSKQGERTDIPLTRAEAAEYERPIRRQVWFGVAGAVAVIILLIVLVMEARSRFGLAQPHPSAVFDGGLQEIVDAHVPLPDAEISIELRTDREGEDRYEVVIRNQDGDVLFQMARDAEHVYRVGHGPREGDSIRFEVFLEIDYGGSITGRYRQDRGVSVASYQSALQALVRQGLAAYVADAGHAVHQDDPDIEPDADSIRRDWDAVMERP